MSLIFRHIESYPNQDDEDNNRVCAQFPAKLKNRPISISLGDHIQANHSLFHIFTSISICL